MCDHPFENSIAISQLLPQLISSVRPHSSQADCINPTLQPSSPDRNILLFPSETAKSPRAERKPTCFLSAGQSKCEAAGCKLGRLHCCCRVAATATSRSRLCWLRNNNYFPFASLRGNNAVGDKSSAGKIPALLIRRLSGSGLAATACANLGSKN